jgi:hypothetical protein
VEKVVALRRLHHNGWRIARNLGLSQATVSRILRRARLSRWRDFHPRPPVERYEHAAPRVFSLLSQPSESTCCPCCFDRHYCHSEHLIIDLRILKMTINGPGLRDPPGRVAKPPKWTREGLL